MADPEIPAFFQSAPDPNAEPVGRSPQFFGQTPDEAATPAFFSGPPEPPTPSNPGRGSSSGSERVPTPNDVYTPKQKYLGLGLSQEEKPQGAGGFGDILKTIGNAALGVAGIPASVISLIAAGDPNAPEGTIGQYGKEGWKNIEQGVNTFAQNVENKPLETTAGIAGSVIGGPHVSEFFKTGDPSAITSNPAETLAQIAINAPAIKLPVYSGLSAMASKGAQLARADVMGAKIMKGVDWAGGKIIPKYGWNDPMYGAEARLEGSLFHKTITQGVPLTEDAAKAMSANPAATPFIAPETNMSTQNLKLLNRASTAYWDAQRKASPTGPYQEFQFNKRGLNLIVDENGFARYGKEAEFNNMSPEQMRLTTNIRTAVDANHDEMFRRGLITPEEFQSGRLGYLHDTKRIFENEGDWINQIKTNPALGPDINAAKAWIQKKNPAYGPDQVENRLWAILKQAKELRTSTDVSGVRGLADSAIASLIKKKNVPPEIAKILGPMENEFLPVRVGQTLDMQNRAILTDQYMQDLKNIRGNDGRYLINTKGSLGYDQNRDFVTLNNEGGPTWLNKWNNAQVHPDIIDAVHVMQNPEVAGSLSKILQTWKTWKVANNPPTHINNVIGDLNFSTLAGHSAYNPVNTPGFLQDAMELANAIQSRNLSPEITLGMQLGTIRPGYGSVELGADYARIMHPGDSTTLAQYIDKMQQSRLQSRITGMYDLEDQVFRYGTWRGLMRKGMSPQQAAIEVNKYFPSYNVTSPVGNWLRGHANLGPLGRSLGAITGGPFTSFPLEAMRIHLLAAREHPVRLAAVNMIPLTLATVGMGMNGMTIQDYHDMLEKQPPYMQGRLMTPVPTPSGPALIDHTQVWPLADWNTRKEIMGKRIPIPLPQNMILNGPGWSAIDLMRNLDTQTGKKIVDPAKGEGAWKVFEYISRQVAPNAAVDLASRVKAGLQETPKTKYAEEPQSLLWAGPQAIAPQVFNARGLGDINKEAKKVERGRLGELKGGFKSIGRDKTLTDAEKAARKENIREDRESIKKGFN